MLIQGYPDDLKQLSPERRRDAFCGKISVCNNLVQAGLNFSLPSKHVSHPAADSFVSDLQQFVGVCRVVNGLHGVCLGAVGLLFERARCAGRHQPGVSYGALDSTHHSLHDLAVLRALDKLDVRE